MKALLEINIDNGSMKSADISRSQTMDIILECLSTRLGSVGLIFDIGYDPMTITSGEIN